MSKRHIKDCDPPQAVVGHALDGALIQVCALRHFLFLSLRLVVALLFLPFELTAQKWLRQFRPDPRCAAITTLGGPAVPGAGTGALHIRAIDIVSREPLGQYRVAILLVTDTATQGPPAHPHDSRDPSGVLLSDLPAGRIIVRSLSIAYSQRWDTIEVRPGALDTVVVPMMLHYTNEIRCTTPHFRRDGESACISSSDPLTEVHARYARQLASVPNSYKREWITGVTESEVELVQDEETCTRAAKAYSNPKDPPRRVIVIRLGQRGFMVYDPYEPHRAGEFSTTIIFDRRWRRIIALDG